MANINNTVAVTREQAVTDVIESVAMVEGSISQIVISEGKKIEKAIEIAKCVSDLEVINASVKETLIVITELERVLCEKLVKASEIR